MKRRRKKEEEEFDEDNFYVKENIQSALEDDEIDAEEAGFMQGFLEDDEE